MFGGECMSLQIVTGRAGAGKTTSLIKEVVNHENPVIYIVPEQMTFQMENTLLKTANLVGMMNIQVFSFNRLAWKVMQETGGLARIFLSKSGIEMILRKAVLTEQTNLKIFQRAAMQKGFYGEISALFKELKQSEITVEEFTQFSSDINKSTADKLHDIRLLFNRYESMLEGKYMESEDYLRLLLHSVSKSTYIQHATVVIDGFDTFTEQELSVIGALAEHAAEVKLAMTLPDEFTCKNLDEYNLFQLGKNYLERIMEMAKQSQVDVLPSVYLNGNKRANNKVIQALESLFAEENGRRNNDRYLGEIRGLHVHQANNRRAEAEGIARQIRELVASKQYKYKDIAILTRGAEQYEMLFNRAFKSNEIPYFFDKKRTMADHPFIEFIRSSLEAIQQNWRYENIFQAIRTEFFFDLNEKTYVSRNQADLLENYCIENGIKAKWRWQKKGDWIYQKIKGLTIELAPQTDEELKIQTTINNLRRRIQEPLERLEKAFSKAQTGTDYGTALYAYFEHVNAAKRLELWREQAEKNNLLELAHEHEQAWTAVVGMLDEFVEILGNEKIDFNTFLEVMMTGLDALEFSLLPPTLDQVIVADMDVAKLLRIKVLFVAGLNDGVFPLRKQENGILSEDDRATIAQQGVSIRSGITNHLIEEEQLAYHLFTTASDQLYLSYPAASDDGKLLMESNYLRKIKAYFTNLSEETYLNDPSLLPINEQSKYIRAKESTLSQLTAQLQLYKRGYSVASVWWDAYNYFMENKDWNKLTNQVLGSLFYTNRAKPISTETAAQLFGENIFASVSRMEKFFSCEFQHFAQYGLKLEERAEFKLQAVDMGEVFHSAMEWISNEIERRNQEWGSLTEKECQEVAKAAIHFLAPKIQHEILLSSKRMVYIQYKLEQIIARATHVLNMQAKISAFRPLGLEVDFGIKGELPPMQIQLGKNRELLLQGRVDRIDVAEEEARSFLRIIDYKSSSHDLRLTEVYYGLALQMLTYLDIVVQNAQKLIGKHAEPAGVLYFHMHNQPVQSDQELTDEMIQEELQKNFRMKGLLLDDPVVISLMDKTLAPGKQSSIIPADLKRDGSMSARSKTASKAEFDRMRQFVRNKYREAGNKMMKGSVSINPYHLQDKTPCQFCAFRSVCQFDPSLDSNTYRYLQNESAEQIIQKMKAEEEDER